MDILREYVNGTSDLINVLAENGFEVDTSSGFAVTYSKCDTNISCDVYSYSDGYFSLINLYNGGVCFNYSHSYLDMNITYAFIAPEADEDRWILLRRTDTIYGCGAQIKVDEDEGWRDIFNVEPYPSLNGIQLVNYYDFPTQTIFGNLYVCKKLPVYRLLKRHYLINVATPSDPSTDPLFPNIDNKTIHYCQHLSGYSYGERHKRLFGERIRIDDKIFIVLDAYDWNYGTNRTEPEEIRISCPAPLAIRVT